MSDQSNCLVGCAIVIQNEPAAGHFSLYNSRIFVFKVLCMVVLLSFDKFIRGDSRICDV